LLWRTRTGRYERLLRARCRGEVRGPHGMRLWVGHGNAGEEVYVLRVTLSLVVSAWAAIDDAERLTVSCAGQHVLRFLGPPTFS
jgi:hypothetical protein